jgi:hypothetical protein
MALGDFIVPQDEDADLILLLPLAAKGQQVLDFKIKAAKI